MQYEEENGSNRISKNKDNLYYLCFNNPIGDT